MKEKNKTYTAADFANYHAGTMPPGEMHALEKAALGDPFLGDALEGYRHLSAVESDIEELQRRLDEKRKKKNIFFISSVAENKWWRIAALFIVMAGAAYFFYRLNFSNKETSLAKNEAKTLRGTKDSTASIKADNATTKNDVVLENRQAPNPAPVEKATLPAAKPRIKKEVAPPIPKSPAALARRFEKSLSYGASSGLISSKNSNTKISSQDAKGYVLKGKVTDENGNSVPYAKIEDKTGGNLAVADTSGRFSLRSRDSSITAMASATGYDPKSFSLNKDLQPTIVLNKRDAELMEVAVTAPDQSKYEKSNSASKALNGKVAGVQNTSDSSRPSGGEEKFDQYLKENISPIYDDNKRLAGEVLLSFTINKKGRPKNIKVVKSSCKGCEQKAIQLLENGPNWIGKKNKPGTVVIKF